jgi:predicted peptidase
MGRRIRLFVNDVQTVEYTEQDPKIVQEGFFGLQIHASPSPVRVEFKDVFIQELPVAEPAASGKTGFLFDELANESGPSSKYVVYIPKGYEESGSQRWPAILFLHGSGERGTDGREPSQTGLGPAIHARPAFPFFAVFPQATRTWVAGSPDAERALRTLEAVEKKYRIDPGQVHLTGLSMGGHGAWTIAAQHPEKWATATVICGFGDVKLTDRVEKLPIQLFCGDRDRQTTVNSFKEIEKLLKEKGAKATATLYPGVGHNSWDRAYNTDSLYTWMLSQHRGEGKAK